MDTIYAPATARGRAGVAVIRISGPDAFEAVRALCGRVPPTRQATLCNLVWQGDVLDQSLVLCFEQGASFTGEKVAELHVHGSTAVVSELMRVLGLLSGLRLAEPGEFTRRALENGKLDLTQVEALADLIDAETEAQRRQAQRMLAGSIGRQAELWRSALIRAAALIAAVLDFSDEEGVPKGLETEVSAIISRLLVDLRREVAGVKSAERVRQGFEVAIVGAPNSGKSTLLNALAGRDAAITSEVAGTTRDVIEVRMDIDGFAVTLLDTAGLRDAVDPVEVIGINKGIARAKDADLRIFIKDENGIPDLLSPGSGDIVVQGKADLAVGEGPGVSGLTGAGVDALVEAIGESLKDKVGDAGLIVRERQMRAVSRAIERLEDAQRDLSGKEMRLEIVASDLSSAIYALDSLVGRVDVESLLDEVFKSFCIGK